MRFFAAAAFLAVLVIGSPAHAGFVDCNDPGTCGWTLSVNGGEVLNGVFAVDEDGNISMAGGPANFDDGNGITASVGPISGNVDPEIVFGVGATNATSAPVTFSFAFSLPLLGFGGTIDTEAALGTTLTAGSAADGHLFPTLGGGKIVDSQDITIVPFNSVDKGVDIGDPLDDPAGGLSTLRNEIENSQITGGPFDIMSVVVAFGLADDNQLIGQPGQVGVGLSGRVTQTLAAPEPAALLLLGMGLAALAVVRRRAQ